MKNEIDSIKKNEKFLKEQGYLRTAKRIGELTNQVISGNTSKFGAVIQFNDIFKIFDKEFEEITPIGHKYRRRCFRESWVVLLQSVTSLQKKGLDMPAEYSIFFDKMNACDDSINSMSGQLAKLLKKQNRSKSESEIMFSSACYTYQVAVEGIFGELARLLYALLSISEGTTIPSSKELSSEHVWKIYRECEKSFGIKPVFLENWKEKSEIRNAIAHAQAQYNPVLDRAHFVSKNRDTGEIYDKTMSFSEFFVIYLEIADAIDAFTYSVRLLSVMQDFTTLLALRREG